MLVARRLFCTAFVLAGVTAAAAGPVAVTGTVTAVAGAAVTLTDAAGATIRLDLPPSVPVTALVPHAAAEIVPGTVVCAPSVVPPDGPRTALEVQIFPGGVADPAHPPCAALGGSGRVAGVVDRMVRGAGHLALQVAGPAGETLVMVGPDTPVVAYEPGDAALLVPGARLLAFGTPTGDGGLAVERVTVGVGGAVPEW